MYKKINKLTSIIYKQFSTFYPNQEIKNPLIFKKRS